MKLFSMSKTPAPPLTAVLLAITLVSCGPSKTTQHSSMRDGSSSAQAPLDLGEDWDARAGSSSASRTATSSRAGRWTIVLGTFAGDHHAQEARVAHQQVTAAVPEVREARVHSTDRGSMLIYGSYAGADDPRAKADLETIKQATLNDAPVFARAFLTPMPRSRAARAESQPASVYDLIKARELYPHEDRLYTVQVAIWGDFESGSLSIDEIRSSAEAYAQQLRAQGHEAYVYHDDRAKQSHVTVGLFGSMAVNSTTGEFSPAVRALLRKFPAHLVNGELLQEPIDPRRPSRGTRVQQPMLVVVPEGD